VEDTDELTFCFLAGGGMAEDMGGLWGWWKRGWKRMRVTVSGEGDRCEREGGVLVRE
jgi:hypothetical protein